MSATTQLLVGANSDVGRKRTENEDRFFIDAQRGIFLVVDGLGGHAAGERAAEIAVDIISTRLSRRTGASDKRIQEAFALASTEIFDAASRHPQWAGMACVATVALIEEDQVTVGHVGDSRLYLLTPGRIEKITRDHSPVGELEDSQRLSEDAAMRHPRRSEVYRDLGSTAHTPNDTDFVEIHSFALPQPAALLLCSDGLTDQVTAADIRQLIDHHAGDPEKQPAHWSKLRMKRGVRTTSRWYWSKQRTTKEYLLLQQNLARVLMLALLDGCGFFSAFSRHLPCSF